MTIEEAEKEMKELFYPEKQEMRRIRIYTNAAGVDMYEEAFENGAGFMRVYIGYKIPRFAQIFKWRQSCTKGYYRLLKKSL